MDGGGLSGVVFTVNVFVIRNRAPSFTNLDANSTLGGDASINDLVFDVSATDPDVGVVSILSDTILDEVHFFARCKLS